MSFKKSISIFVISSFLFLVASAQSGYWQQSVKYVMNIDMDVKTNRFTGKQRLEYSNQSPDKLNRVFFHLYWNAFQPNSSMDVRSRELGKVMVNGRSDWDGRVRDRIQHLTDDEIGYQKVLVIKMNGVPQKTILHETILEVVLDKPILPKTKVVFDMEFEAQVPLQVRRSGRDNPQTGVRYSMSQWYPKICAYDKEGWHPTPYIAREFYGEWGDFDVSINIDKDYKLGGTGVLQNAAEIGWGYDKPGTELKPTVSAKRKWRFVGNKVHDFVWAADPDYKHISRKVTGGPDIHVIYNYKADDGKNDSAWMKIADAAVTVLPFIEKNFGKYPYPQYSFIHGGDGGMEYAMATLISGPSLGTAFHEWMHNWYQMILGTNESLYPWMDEGFTSYAEDLVSKFYNKRSSLDDYKDALAENPKNDNLKQLITSLPEDHAGAYASYFSLVKSGLAEPLTTHSDHYNSNFAYSINAYSKGEVFMEQLGYIVGAPTRDKILLEYYNQWKFRHPDADDFIRVSENVSGMKLDWYKEYWVNGTKTINYAIDSLWQEGDKALLRLKRIGAMPMPVDLEISFRDGSKESHYIPLNIMYGSKPNETPATRRIDHEEWRWTNPTYVIEIDRKLTDILKAEIDPTKRMADVERKNNLLELNW